MPRFAPMWSGCLRRTGIDASGGRILLLCYPRVLGFVFNPISVYFVPTPPAEDLAAVIYEVRNTFGQLHCYVCPVERGQLTEAGSGRNATSCFTYRPSSRWRCANHFRIKRRPTTPWPFVSWRRPGRPASGGQLLRPQAAGDPLGKS